MSLLPHRDRDVPPTRNVGETILLAKFPRICYILQIADFRLIDMKHLTVFYAEALMEQHITDAQWEHFWENGYVRIGQVASDAELADLQQRMDDIMLGKAPLDYDKIMMQLDREPGKNSPGPQSRGHKGATLLYRKIQNLELDAYFLAYLQKPIFRDVCAKIYGDGTPVACFRAMFMNKPAHEGTYLVWHQDRWTDLDRDPRITIYTALDAATIANGCVHIIPKSHSSLINPSHGSGFLSQEHIDEIVANATPEPLELAAGEVVLLTIGCFTVPARTRQRFRGARSASAICMARRVLATAQPLTAYLARARSVSPIWQCTVPCRRGLKPRIPEQKRGFDNRI